MGTGYNVYTGADIGPRDAKKDLDVLTGCLDAFEEHGDAVYDEEVKDTMHALDTEKYADEKSMYAIEEPWHDEHELGFRKVRLQVRDIEGHVWNAGSFTKDQMDIIQKYEGGVDSSCVLSAGAFAYPYIDKDIAEVLTTWNRRLKDRKLLPKLWLLGQTGITDRRVISFCCHALEFGVDLSERFYLEKIPKKSWYALIDEWEDIDMWLLSREKLEELIKKHL